MAAPVPGIRLSQAQHTKELAGLRSGFTCPQEPTGTAHCALRGPALGDAIAMARFAVAGRACGLCGQLIGKPDDQVSRSVSYNVN